MSFEFDEYHFSKLVLNAKADPSIRCRPQL